MALQRGRASGAVRGERKRVGRVVFIYLPFAALIVFAIATTTGSLQLTSGRQAQEQAQVRKTLYLERIFSAI